MFYYVRNWFLIVSWVLLGFKGDGREEGMLFWNEREVELYLEMVLYKVNIKGLWLLFLVLWLIFLFLFFVLIKVLWVRVIFFWKKVFCVLLLLIICVFWVFFILIIVFISWLLLNFFLNKLRNLCYRIVCGGFFLLLC